MELQSLAPLYRKLGSRIALNSSSIEKVVFFKLLIIIKRKDLLEPQFHPPISVAYSDPKQANCISWIEADHTDV